MENTKTTLEEVLQKFSINNRYYIQFWFLAFLGFASNSLYSSNYIFAVEDIKYRCADETFSNNSCGSVDGARCTEWIYEDPHSFVAEFQLACEDWKRTLVGTIHSFGYMVGLLIIGPLSDRIGRKKAVILTGVMGGVLGVAKSFCHSYWIYIVLEFLESAIGDSCSPLFVLNLEIVSAKKRVIFNYLCNMGYAFGAMLFPLAAWGVPYWRNFLRVIYAPALAFLAYYFLIDESPRWLLIKGKKEKAIAVVQKMGKKSKVKLDKDALDKCLIVEEDKSIGFVELLKMTLKSKALLIRCLVCIVWWTTSTFVSYGIMINSVSLQGNKYVNYALLSAVDIPGNLMIMYILCHFKRRNPLICSFFAAGVMCLLQPLMPEGLPWLSLTVYVISKLMTSFYFSITYIYTSELFPTYTRNSMHAMCSSIGRIGSIIAPQTPLLMVYWSSLPIVIFGVASLCAGLVTFLVPDTANVALPDTVRQAEDLGKKKKNNLAMIGIDNLGLTKD